MAIVKEDIGTEIADFREDSWKEDPIYIDKSMGFYKALNGGEVNNTSLCALICGQCCGCGCCKARKEKAQFTEEGFGHNMKGEGLITGGIFIVRQGGGVEWAYLEKKVMQVADKDEVIRHAISAASYSPLKGQDMSPT